MCFSNVLFFLQPFSLKSAVFSVIANSTSKVRYIKRQCVPAGLSTYPCSAGLSDVARVSVSVVFVSDDSQQRVKALLSPSVSHTSPKLVSESLSQAALEFQVYSRTMDSLSL